MALVSLHITSLFCLSNVLSKYGFATTHTESIISGFFSPINQNFSLESWNHFNNVFWKQNLELATDISIHDFM